MPASSLSYICLKPTNDSGLSFSDVKELLDSLEDKTRAELVIKSSQPSGLELYIGISKTSLDRLVKHIYSLSPGLIITKVKSSEVHLNKPTIDLSYKLNHHYAYPLYVEEVAKGDDLLKLLRFLVQLKEKEEIHISFSLAPARPLKASLLRKRLLAGSRPPRASITPMSLATNSIVAGLDMTDKTLNIIAGLLSPNKNHNLKIVDKRSILLLDKLFESLFKARLGIKIKSFSPKRSAALVSDIESAINQFTGAIGYQQLKSAKKNTSPDILSASDLAAFFNFSSLDLNSGLFSLARIKTLPRPANQSSRVKEPGDVILGFNNYQGVNSDLALRLADRYRHVYINGATGSGKSTLLANLILQDINSGQGTTLVDPHGDLAEDVINRIPINRRTDVIYFDTKSSIGINLLEHNNKPGSKDYPAEADQITESIISMFRKVFGEELSGHRIEYILRNSIQTALTIPDSTIFTIYRLLTDRSYRFAVTTKLTNPDLINFWRNELGRAGAYQQVKMTAGVTAKIGRFLFSDSAKRVFGQPKSNLYIEKVINERKILICNFAKGALGEDGSKLFSTALLTKLQLAALSRAKIKKEDRVDHFVYVDEFQTYAPSVITQILSEARKYGLYLTMAEQSPSQQDPLSTSMILANVGNLLCFRTASTKDARLLLPNFKDQLTSADLINLPAYSFYLKTTAEQDLAPTSGQSYPLLDDYSPSKSESDDSERNERDKISKYRLRRAI